MTTIGLSYLPNSTAQAVTSWTGSGVVVATVTPVTEPALEVSNMITGNNIVALHTISGGTLGGTYTVSVAQGSQSPQTFTVTRENQPE
jgi:hypothetical protein